MIAGVMSLAPRFLSAIGFAAALTLAACGSAAPSASPPPSSAASAPAGAVTPASASAAAKPAASASAAAKPVSSAPASGLVKLVAAHSNPIAESMHLYVAKEAGTFEKNGLDVD